MIISYRRRLLINKFVKVKQWGAVSEVYIPVTDTIKTLFNLLRQAYELLLLNLLARKLHLVAGFVSGIVGSPNAEYIVSTVSPTTATLHTVHTGLGIFLIITHSRRQLVHHQMQRTLGFPGKIHTYTTYVASINVIPLGKVLWPRELQQRVDDKSVYAYSFMQHPKSL